MDGDDESIKNNKTKRNETNFIQRCVTNVSDVFFTIWLRCVIQIDDGHNGIILGSGYRFLLYFRFFLVLLYISYEILK